MHFSLLIGNMRRVIVLNAVLLLVVGAVGACRSTIEKRVKKDIIGINEQLYDLEKNQIRDASRLKKLEGEIKSFKSEDTQEKEAANKEDVDQIYKDGYKDYLEQNYTEAIKRFSQLTGQFKSDSLIDNALYWQAESYLKLNQSEQALNFYQLIYRYFPFSNKADYALYKIGLIYLEMKNDSRALLAFNRLVSEYPDSDLYKTVSLKIKELKNKNRRSQ
jgi:TolA-binding protein